jgi:hypothetical protein
LHLAWGANFLRSFLQRGRRVVAHHVVFTIRPTSAAGRTGHDRRDWIGGKIVIGAAVFALGVAAGAAVAMWIAPPS